MKTSSDKSRLAALVSYIRFRDQKAATDERTLLEILACASLRYQARASKPLLNVELQMTAGGLQSTGLTEALALPVQDAGPDLSSLDAVALQVLEEVLAASPEERREPLPSVLPLSQTEEGDTELWLGSLQRRRSKQPTATAAL